MNPPSRTTFERKRATLLTMLLLAGLHASVHAGVLPPVGSPLTPVKATGLPAQTRGAGTAAATSPAEGGIDLSLKGKDGSQAHLDFGSAPVLPQASSLANTAAPPPAGLVTLPSTALPVDTAGGAIAAAAVLGSAWLLNKAFPAMNGKGNSAPVRKRPPAIPDRGAGPPSTSDWK